MHGNNMVDDLTSLVDATFRFRLMKRRNKP